jgi:hypothetical protein
MVGSSAIPCLPSDGLTSTLPAEMQVPSIASWVPTEWCFVPRARARPGRVAIDVPHLRGTDPETLRERRLYVRADQARHRREAEKKKRLDELNARGFADLPALKREMQRSKVAGMDKPELVDLYRRYKGGKGSRILDHHYNPTPDCSTMETEYF